MKKLILLTILCYHVQLTAKDLRIPMDTAVITRGSISVKEQLITYKVHTGTHPVFDNNGKIKAILYYTYYYRLDVKNKENRPLLMSFNGGPES